MCDRIRCPKCKAEFFECAADKAEEATPMTPDEIEDITPPGHHSRSLSTQQIARAAHEINRAYCEAIGDHSQPPWEEAPLWQKRSAMGGVLFHLWNRHAGPEASHENWLAQKKAEGWTYGPVKDPEKKQHPCMVPFEDLPVEQQAKDYLFRAVVHALALVE